MSFPLARDEQAQCLREIVGHDGLTVPEQAAPDIVSHDDRFDNEYGRLGERLYSGFVAMAAASGEERLIKLAERPNILNGSYVMTSILRYAPAAYQNFLESRNTSEPEPESSVTELGDIMRRSSDIVKLFADRGQRSNSTYEINFGLWHYPPVFESVPFVIEPDIKGIPVFHEAPLTSLHTGREIMSRRVSGDLTPEDDAEVCPAIGRVMTAFWNTGINVAVQEPQLFEAGLAEAQASVQPTEAQP